MRSPVATEIVLRANTDWVDLSEVVWVVRSVGGKEDADEIVETALDAIRELISDELVVIGDVGTDGFSQWRLPVDEALERVRREWAALGRDPWPGDLFWLANTSAGDALAEDIFRRREVPPED